MGCIKLGYLSQVKVKGKRYIYLKEYQGKKNGKITEPRIYAFGHRSIALQRMKEWQKDFSTFPEYLKKLGYDENDLQDWINTLETGVSKTGRSKKFV